MTGFHEVKNLICYRPISMVPSAALNLFGQITYFLPSLLHCSLFLGTSILQEDDDSEEF